MIPDLPKSQAPDDAAPFLAALRRIALAVLYDNTDPDRDWSMANADHRPDGYLHYEILARRHVQKADGTYVLIRFGGDSLYDPANTRVLWWRTEPSITEQAFAEWRARGGMWR